MRASNLLARNVVPKKGVASLWLSAGKSQEIGNVERGNLSSGRLSPCHVTCPTKYELFRILSVHLSIPRILAANLSSFFVFFVLFWGRWRLFSKYIWCAVNGYSWELKPL